MNLSLQTQILIASSMLVWLLSVGCAQAKPVPDSHKLTEIHLRDPYILPVAQEKKYYLYGTGFRLPDGPGFMVYQSDDLVNWTGPSAAFRRPKDFWATRAYWAPEVHPYKDKYYMFATYIGDKVNRGTQILVADTPQGPFVPHSDGPVTPRDWACLDGTLFIDDTNQPWMVFCHQWANTPTLDGEFCAQQLSEDLTRAIGEPILLFKASVAKWSVKAGRGEKKGYISDGPFLHRTKGNTLLMLWSSFGEGGVHSGGYKLAQCRSESGKITGPWIHPDKPLREEDSGHGMLFRTFEGDLMVTFHYPNRRPEERPIIIKVKEQEPWLVMDKPETP